ncbi:MAG TPA: hypothetical protein ENI87_00085, partial [bacterium]|nr:hypothetical protein [bacterium]
MQPRRGHRVPAVAGAHTRERWLVDPESDTLTVIDPRHGPLAAPSALGRGARRRALVAEVSMHDDRSEQSSLPLAV